CLAVEIGLARCSAALLADRKEVMIEAIEHLRVAANVARVYIAENFIDDDHDLCARLLCESRGERAGPSRVPPGMIIEYDQGMQALRERLERGEVVTSAVADLGTAVR